MKQIRFVVVVLCVLMGTASLLRAQKPGAKTGSGVSMSDPSKANIGTIIEQMQRSASPSSDETPPAVQVVVQFLQLRPDQVQEFGVLLQARQAAVVPVLQAIQQRTQQLEALLNSGAGPVEIGVLVIQIHALQQQVAQAQQSFLSKFTSLLDAEQQQRLEAVRIAAQLQPILPAFQQLYLF